MGDVCTGSPTLTSFSTSTALSTVVTQSTSQSISVGEASVVTRTVTSGTSVIVEESTIPGVTATVQVEVPVTLTNEQVITVPVATLFAPCSATTTSTPTTRSSSTSSDAPETTPTPDPGTSSTRSRSTANQASQTNNNQAANTQNNAATTPAATTPASQTPQTETGTLITSFSTGIATLSDGSQSSFVTSFTTSIPPNGTLNGNGSNGGGSGSNSKAVAIGVGVTGGVIALIILMFGITWHIRRRRRNSFEGMDDGDIWNPGNEPKNPLSPRHNVRAGSGYTYNPYADAPVRYAPVPTGSPPVSRPLSLADPNAGNGYPPPYPPGALPSTLGVTAPLLGRAKTADEILYEAAREDLPRSRTSSAAASHQTRASETGLIHRPNASVSASHRTHTSVSASHMTHASESMKSRRSESVGGMLADHQDVHARYQGAIGAPLEPERSMSPVSVVAPRLAIANPDTDRD